MKTQTHIDKVALEVRTNKETIKKMFGLSELEYNTRFFECGIAFLEMVFPTGSRFEQFQCHHSYTSMFWGWFSLQYKIADDAYLTSLKKPIWNEFESFEIKEVKGVISVSSIHKVPKPRLENYDHLVRKLLTTNTRFQDSFNNYLNAIKKHEKTMLTS